LIFINFREPNPFRGRWFFTPGNADFEVGKSPALDALLAKRPEAAFAIAKRQMLQPIA
jgi:hypothetical protein